MNLAEAIELGFNPRRTLVATRCPWCGADVVLGHRGNAGNVSLSHVRTQELSIEDAGKPLVEQGACARFTDLNLTRPVELLALMKKAGATWRKLAEG